MPPDSGHSARIIEHACPVLLHIHMFCIISIIHCWAIEQIFWAPRASCAIQCAASPQRQMGMVRYWQLGLTRIGTHDYWYRGSEINPFSEPWRDKGLYVALYLASCTCGVSQTGITTAGQLLLSPGIEADVTLLSLPFNIVPLGILAEAWCLSLLREECSRCHL